VQFDAGRDDLQLPEEIGPDDIADRAPRVQPDGRVRPQTDRTDRARF
jgi:hypothetical protein